MLSAGIEDGRGGADDVATGSVDANVSLGGYTAPPRGGLVPRSARVREVRVLTDSVTRRMELAYSTPIHRCQRVHARSQAATPPEWHGVRL
jgi:hypothetical protein